MTSVMKGVTAADMAQSFDMPHHPGAEKYDREAGSPKSRDVPVRKLAGDAGLVVGAVAVAMSVYHVYARLTVYAPDQQALLYITLAFSLVLSFLLWPRSKGATLDRVPWSDLVLAGLSLACVGDMFVNYNYVVNRFPLPMR